jgi:hypothetical protein
MASTSRRSLLTGLATAPVVLTPTWACADTSAIDALWREYLQSTRHRWELNRLIDEREAQLPWWVQEGPKYIGCDGGRPVPAQLSRSPAIQNMEPPTHPAAVRMIRPERRDLQHDRDTSLAIFPHHEARIVSVYEQRITELEAREAAAQAETEKLGIPALVAKSEAMAMAAYDAEKAVEALPFSLERLAALVLIRLHNTATVDDCLSDNWSPERTVLHDLSPMLRGAVAETVAEFIANEDRPYGLGPLWDYPWAPPGNRSVRSGQA